jgi:hypothetical protein
MDDYFLLDPDYKDLDFPNKYKLKFKTVYGEQRGSLIEGIIVLIGFSTFVLILFFGFASEWRWLRNSDHTFGTVTQSCQASQNWYTYSFEANDKFRNPRQYAGQAFSDRNTPCHKVGDTIRVEYLRNDPDTSREFSGYSYVFTDLYGYIFVSIFYGYFAYSTIGNIRAFLLARPKYAHLKSQSIFIGGTTRSVSKVDNQWRLRGYYIEVDYEFWVDKEVIKGTQIKRRDDLKGKPLPVRGTPVRILYADENTYVML